MKNDTTKWSQTSGLILGKLSAIWFAAMVAVILFAIPTKLVWWLITWFWQLF